jgi:hypothetical protein
VDGNGKHTLPPRPNILRGHHHSCSSSSNQSQIQGTSFRALRFEPSSSHSSLSAKAWNGVIRVLCLERSSSPPRRVIHEASNSSILIRLDESGEAEGAGESLLLPERALAPPAVRDLEDTSVEVNEDEYGDVIERPEGASKPLLEELHTEGHPRGSSSASSSSSLSSIISPDSATAYVPFYSTSVPICHPTFFDAKLFLFCFLCGPTYWRCTVYLMPMISYMLLAHSPYVYCFNAPLI